MRSALQAHSARHVHGIDGNIGHHKACTVSALGVEGKHHTNISVSEFPQQKNWRQKPDAQPSHFDSHSSPWLLSSTQLQRFLSPPTPWPLWQLLTADGLVRVAYAQPRERWTYCYYFPSAHLHRVWDVGKIFWSLAELSMGLCGYYRTATSLSLAISRELMASAYTRYFSWTATTELTTSSSPSREQRYALDVEYSSDN